MYKAPAIPQEERKTEIAQTVIIPAPKRYDRIKVALLSYHPSFMTTTSEHYDHST